MSDFIVVVFISIACFLMGAVMMSDYRDDMAVERGYANYVVDTKGDVTLEWIGDTEWELEVINK